MSIRLATSGWSAQDRLMVRGLLLIVAAGLLAARPGYSASPLPDASFVPVGTWSYDTARQRCAAAQTFASGRQRIVLGFKKVPMTDGFGMFLEAPGTILRKEYRELSFSFGATEVARGALAGRSARSNHIFYEFGAPDTEFQAMLAAKSFGVRAPDWNAQMRLDGIDAMLARLEACASTLLAKWGLSPEDQARIASYPKLENDGRGLFSAEDFPTTAIWRGAIGTVEARVTVREDGTPADCLLVRSSGHADLDRTMCRVLLTRAKFKPAVARDGRAMSSPYYLRSSWLMSSSMNVDGTE